MEPVTSPASSLCGDRWPAALAFLLGAMWLMWTITDEQHLDGPVFDPGLEERGWARPGTQPMPDCVDALGGAKAPPYDTALRPRRAITRRRPRAVRRSLP